MRENIRSRERVKLFFNFIVFSFGVPKPGNYRKFRTCFMRVKISRVNQQRKLLTKSLLWALPTHHECETKIVTVFLKAQLSTPAASSPCVPCRYQCPHFDFEGGKICLKSTSPPERSLINSLSTLVTVFFPVNRKMMFASFSLATYSRVVP